MQVTIAFCIGDKEVQYLRNDGPYYYLWNSEANHYPLSDVSNILEYISRFDEIWDGKASVIITPVYS